MPVFSITVPCFLCLDNGKWPQQIFVERIRTGPVCALSLSSDGAVVNGSALAVRSGAYSLALCIMPSRCGASAVLVFVMGCLISRSDEKRRLFELTSSNWVSLRRADQRDQKRPGSVPARWLRVRNCEQAAMMAGVAACRMSDQKSKQMNHFKNTRFEMNRSHSSEVWLLAALLSTLSRCEYNRPSRARRGRKTTRRTQSYLRIIRSAFCISQMALRKGKY